MANPKKRMNAKGAAPSVDALIRATIADLRNMAANQKGKPKYLEDLDSVLYEIYGVKKIGSKFCSGKKQIISKVIKKIDFKSLVLMIKGSERSTKGLLAAIVKIHARVENDYESSTKEIKKAKETIKEACKLLRKVYHIEKYKDPSDVSIKDLRKFLDNNDSYGYGYDDDYDDDDYGYDYDDDDVDFGGGGSAIETLFDKYKSTSDSYDTDDEDDDDDYDEIKKTISSGDMANERLDTLIEKVINPMINKIDHSTKYMSSIDEKLDRLSSLQSIPAAYVPLPTESPTLNPAGDMKSITAALNDITKKLAANDAKFAQIARTTDILTDIVRDMAAEEQNDDVEYEEDDTDETEESSDAVSMDAINSSFTGVTDYNSEPSSPIPLKR